MNDEAVDFWQRALRAVKTAEEWCETDPDAAASRAYYAAFYAVSALFALEGKTFGKHTALQAAVHRDLVKAGRLPLPVGAAYSALADLRNTGDYGGPTHVDAEQAAAAVNKATLIIQAVRAASPEPFPEA